ncbi:MAG: hypothetical protein ACTHLV_15970, partial [Achromobacter mucicolens]
IGKDKAESFDDLRGIVNSITFAASMLARLWPREIFRSDQEWAAHRQKVDEFEAIFWEGLKDSDPINPKLSAVIERIESVCRSVIEGKGTIYGFLNKRIGRG